MYDLGRPLDNDTKELCRFFGYRDYRQLNPILRELIQAGKIIVTDDGKLTNDRFKKELDAAHQRIENAQKGGKGKAEKRERKLLNRYQRATSGRSQDPSIEEKQSLNPCSPSPSIEKEKKKYAFRGKIIRLTEADFDTWRRNYSHITDLRGWLQKKDDWLAAIPKEKLGNWFQRTSTHLASENEKAARQSVSTDREAEAHAAGHLSSPL